MAGVGALISSLLSSATKLLPEIKKSFFAPSSSSSAQSPKAIVVGDNLNKLIRTLKKIKETMRDAEEREMQDYSVKLWLKELKEVGREAEYVLDEYMYEVYRAKVEARDFSELNPRKRKQEEGSTVPDVFVDRIKEIRSRFDKIAKDGEALRLREEDGSRRDEGVSFRASSSRLIFEPNVFGRKRDKEKVIELLFSSVNERMITVLPIVGKGGLGKTTLAQLVYNNREVNNFFDKFAWISVFEDFNVERLSQQLVESFTKNSCFIKSLSTLQDKIKGIVERKRVFIVLDGVWNENQTLWESLYAPFISAAKVAFIVTTRSDRVANIMQTTSPFRLGYLLEHESWSLFHYYAFENINHGDHPNLLNVGKHIVKKCGGLPLALKSIANLLRHKKIEESWTEVLRSDLWEIHAKNEIFGALQISYTRMPSYLKPCFLCCSLFPKGYEYNVNELIELWIGEGYIESKENRTKEGIAFGYALELRERSFFEPGFVRNKQPWSTFKIHDMVHDFARLNSGNELYSIEGEKQPSRPPNEVLHIYMDAISRKNIDMDDLKEELNPLAFDSVVRLRTLVLKSRFDCIDLWGKKSLRVLKLCYKGLLQLVLPKHLRFLELDCSIDGSLVDSICSLYHLEWLNLNLNDSLIELETIGNLVNLQSLRISRCYMKKFPDSLCLLSNLKTLNIKYVPLVLLPNNIGNLAQLQELVIHGCWSYCFLPESFCKLSKLVTLKLTECRVTNLPNHIGNLINLQRLVINGTEIKYLPPSFSNLNIYYRLDAKISLRLNGLSDTINWLKNFDNLRGTLAILNIGCIPTLEDARNFNLISKPNVEKLLLSWAEFAFLDEAKNRLEIKIETDYNSTKKTKSIRELLGEDTDLQLLESLQPHPNLKYLQIWCYKNFTFPNWIGDSLSCASLRELFITHCNVTHLQFGNLGSLKHLKIDNCPNLPIISRESVPSNLQSLTISWCPCLLSITELEDLEWLAELGIDNCEKLVYLPFKLISEERFDRKSSALGLRIFSPLTKLKIHKCPSLKLAPNEVIPSMRSNIDIYCSIGLMKWCFQHNINYK